MRGVLAVSTFLGGRHPAGLQWSGGGDRRARVVWQDLQAGSGQPAYEKPEERAWSTPGESVCSPTLETCSAVLSVVWRIPPRLAVVLGKRLR